MKLVFIYGAPGVGKLTTAQALAALTGFRLFHNHLSFNLVTAVFDFPSPPFRALAGTIRLAALEAAARARMPGLIFTFVYAAPEDDAFAWRSASSRASSRCAGRWRTGTSRPRFGSVRRSRSTTPR